MKLGRMVFNARDCAALNLGDWYRCHVVLNRMFREKQPAELLWHCEGRCRDGISFLFLATREPDVLPGTTPDIAVRDFPESALPTEGHFEFQVRYAGRRWESLPDGTEIDETISNVRRSPKGILMRQVGLTPEQAAAVIVRRGPEWGIDVHDAVHQGVRYERLRHRDGPIPLVMHDIAGTFTITDPARFRQAAFHGIGARTAFGCGLLRYGRL